MKVTMQYANELGLWWSLVYLVDSIHQSREVAINSACCSGITIISSVNGHEHDCQMEQNAILAVLETASESAEYDQEPEGETW